MPRRDVLWFPMAAMIKIEKGSIFVDDWLFHPRPAPPRSDPIISRGRKSASSTLPAWPTLFKKLQLGEFLKLWNAYPLSQPTNMTQKQKSCGMKRGLRSHGFTLDFTFSLFFCSENKKPSFISYVVPRRTFNQSSSFKLGAEEWKLPLLFPTNKHWRGIIAFGNCLSADVRKWHWISYVLALLSGKPFRLSAWVVSAALQWLWRHSVHYYLCIINRANEDDDCKSRFSWILHLAISSRERKSGHLSSHAALSSHVTVPSHVVLPSHVIQSSLAICHFE